MCAKYRTLPIFLCISGFLYGLAPKRNTIEFYHSRFLKILVPYYIVYIPFGLLEFIFFPKSFSIPRFIGGLFCRAFISGAGHLWFVSLILLCYILTPLLQLYRVRYIQDKCIWLVYSIFSFFIITIWFGLFNNCFFLHGYAVIRSDLFLGKIKVTWIKDPFLFYFVY